MQRVLNQSRPQFQLHDRHPALRGVAVLILALVFVAAFLATMPSGAPSPSPAPEAIAVPARS